MIATIPWRYRLLVTLLVLECLARPASATTLEELQAQGRLSIESAVTPTGQLVPGQKARLTLKIATDRWFSGGTRIAIPEVPGLVILQTEQFASNASENRAGKSWVVQRWTLDIFPQRAGDFSIPPIAVSLKVNAGDSNNVEGSLYSPSTRFSVDIPESLKQAQEWVAAPLFTVSQTFDRSLEDLRPGDAFERNVVFEAEDVMAMMLPEVKPETFSGLKAYPDPPTLENNTNRGQSTARRGQSISYVVEAAGEYRLPELEFLWWDTTSAKLELLTLPETVITVQGSAAPAPESAIDISPRQGFLWAAGLLGVIATLWLIRRLLPQVPVARMAAALSGLWQKLQEMRRPALPDQLNPGSSAGDKRASG